MERIQAKTLGKVLWWVGLPLRVAFALIVLIIVSLILPRTIQECWESFVLPIIKGTAE